MYILATMMLLNLFLLTGINNVCSTLMEEIFAAKILAEDIFVEFVFAVLFQKSKIKFRKIFLTGTNFKNKFSDIFLNWFSHKTKVFIDDIFSVHIKNSLSKGVETMMFCNLRDTAKLL